MLAGKLVGHSGHVFAFEPAPENYELLVRNVNRNGLKNVTCEMKAVGNFNGRTRLYSSPVEPGLHSTAVARSRKSVMSEVVRLDHYLESKNRVNLIKMDPIQPIRLMRDLGYDVYEVDDCGVLHDWLESTQRTFTLWCQKSGFG